MRFSTVSALVLVIAPLAFASPAPFPETLDLAESAAGVEQAQKDAAAAILQFLEEKEEAAVKKRTVVKGCSLATLKVRREFGSLSKPERKAYTDAVLCLQSKPAKTPASVSSGARNRFDDFVVTHIVQTLAVHYSGTFLGWHRYYIHIYEQALREECGFKGTLPYWDWPKYASAPQDSPIFNGDAYSMSGNGKLIPGHEGVTLYPAFEGLGDLPIFLDAGLGGGCVETGPFKNYTVNLGPVGLQGSPPGPEGGLGYNPRCLKRDVGPGVNTKYANWTAVLNTIAQPTLADFQWVLQGKPGSQNIGVHGGGHFTIGGDPGGDVFISPSDPAFYLHHAHVDRVWSIWQALHPSQINSLSGTNTFLNIPPSANTTLTDPVQLGYAGGTTLQMKDVLSTVKGPFCYMYL